MHVVIVDPDKTSLTTELREWCEAREILVEEKFTFTNTQNVQCPTCGGNTHGSYTCEKCGDGVDW